jgi:Asp-tRNA(Asn)/Glu-tRNA(Gln) amidotransferase A subunit family amidase
MSHFYYASDLTLSFRLEPNTRITTALGSSVTALEGLASERLRHYGFNYVTSLMNEQRLSAIITPTIGIDVPILSEDAKELGESNTAMSLALTKHIFLGNLLGLPGLSVPMGFLKPSLRYESEPEELTLPVGIQLLGDHWSEHKVSPSISVSTIPWSLLFLC